MQYRYFLIDNGLRHPPEEFEAESDDEAHSLAQKFMNGSDIEVWQGDRLVVIAQQCIRLAQRRRERLT